MVVAVGEAARRPRTAGLAPSPPLTRTTPATIAISTAATLLRANPFHHHERDEKLRQVASGLGSRFGSPMAPPPGGLCTAAAIVRPGEAGVKLPRPHPHHVQPARAEEQQADGDGNGYRLGVIV